jgi:hypothetical protein
MSGPEQSTELAAEPSTQIAVLPSTHTDPSTTGTAVSDSAAATATPVNEKNPSPKQSLDIVEQDEPKGPELVLTLLVISGLRITMKLDSHYLASHSSLTAFSHPEKVSIGAFKSCIYSCWQEDWGATAPASSASIRLIYLGKVLQDDQTFEECKIISENAHNVVHLSVKSASFELEPSDKVKQPKGRFRNRSGQGEGESRSGGGCCIIV